MRHRTLPHLPGMPISVLGFGCMRLPICDGDMTRIDEAQAIPLIRQAIDQGVNLVDTGYAYHGGQSEVVLGKALRDGYGQRVHIADKSPVWLVETSADWERLLDEQLKRLDVNRIEFYLLHALNAPSWAKAQRLGALQAMERAMADGRIGHLGFSFHDALDVFKQILQGYDWTFCTLQHNFIDEGFQAGTQGLRLAGARGVGVMVMEPLRGGGLAHVPSAVAAMWAEAPAARTPAQWALRWLWNRREVTTVLSGMNHPQQLAENVQEAEAAQVGQLTQEELDVFEKVRGFYLSRLAVPCTTCGYCEPCPEGVAIPSVFTQANHARMFDAKPQASALYRMYVRDPGHGADRCTSCGTCLPACPQGIDIPARLAMAHRDLMEL